MKSIALVALGVLLGVVVMLFVPHGSPQVVYADPPSGNGDVNGSGKIDIADPIYLLDYLFNQGPDPETIACDLCCPPVCPPQHLPATGQTACYGYELDNGWVEVPCDSAGHPGQDGFYQAGCPTAGRFTDNGDGTVTDNCTGLVWQKETADINGDGTITRDEDGLLWRNALTYCEDLELAGRDDWRLPNVRELQSLVDYGRYDPSIDPVFGAVSACYWSSSTDVRYPDSVWYISFGVGFVFGNGDRISLYFVRAVRDAD